MVNNCTRLLSFKYFHLVSKDSKFFFLFITSFLIILSKASAQYLQADGTKIVNSEGNEVILRGIGLGGWMLQEGYMLKTSGPQHQLESNFEDLLGTEKKKEFYDAWLDNHVRKIDIDSMASWGFNSIRLPMHYKLFTLPIEEEPVAGENTWLDKGFTMTDSLLSWAKANNMYLILDLHAAPGGQGENADISDYDPSKPSLWESEANQDKTVALWKKLAERYAEEPNIGAYDIINEPNWGFLDHENDLNGCAESQNTPLWDLQKRITEAIRQVDQNHIIIIEGNCWGNNYSGLPTLWDDNIVISYHKYWNSNAQSSIQGMLNMRQQKNVPIWLGETGENSNSWFTDAIMLLEGNSVGWSWWPLKKLGYNNPLQVETNAGYQQILDYWSGKAAKPTEQEAYEAVMQLAENLKLENNIYHKDVVDAMIRQPHSQETLPFGENGISSEATTRIYATDFDLGRHGIAYKDEEYTNETGNAGGLAWNQGYSYRNDGVDIQSCSDEITNGYNVGWTADGEWLQYTLSVDSTGVYDVDLRYAAGNGTSKVKLLVNAADQSGTVSLPSTGGYQSWGTLTVNDVVLYKGTQKVKILIEKGGFNLNYLAFTLKKKTSELAFSIISGETSKEGGDIYLSLNKTVASETLNSSGFLCTVGGQSVAVSDVNADAGDARKIILSVDGDDLTDGSEIRVSYSGSEIKATDDTSLEEFTDLLVKNNLPVHIMLPAKIEAEDFTVNQGLQLETTTDTGGGENVGYTNSGDYLDYLINVPEASNYQVEVRVACQSNAGIVEFQQLSPSGEVLNSKQIDVPVTGGWQTWKTVSTKMRLEEGRGTLRVQIVQPEFNINWYRFTQLGVVNGVREEQQGLKIYPNPVKDHLTIEMPDHAFSPENSVAIWEVNGNLVFQGFQLSPEEIRKLNVGSLTSGFYVMILNMKSKSWEKKFLVE